MSFSIEWAIKLFTTNVLLSVCFALLIAQSWNVIGVRDEVLGILFEVGMQLAELVNLPIAYLYFLNDEVSVAVGAGCFHPVIDVLWVVFAANVCHVAKIFTIYKYEN